MDISQNLKLLQARVDGIEERLKQLYDCENAMKMLAIISKLEEIEREFMLLRETVNRLHSKVYDQEDEWSRETRSYLIKRIRDLEATGEAMVATMMKGKTDAKG